MRKDRYWGTNLELLVLSDLIYVYTSSDQEDPEFKIDHLKNIFE